eukprot:scaffold153846_cov32-Prasinocladus_malaysianus.AAC.1
MLEKQIVEEAEADFRKLKVRFYELSDLRTRNAQRSVRPPTSGSSSFRGKAPQRISIDDGEAEPPATPAPKI